MEKEFKDLFCDLITELDDYSFTLIHDEDDYYPGIDESIMDRFNTENEISTEIYFILKKYVDKYKEVVYEKENKTA